MMQDSKGLTTRAPGVVDRYVPPVAAPPPPPTEYGVEVEPEGLRLRDYWRVLRKRLWLVAGITLLITALAVVYMARQPDIYLAKASVQVNLESTVPTLGTTGGAPVPANDPAYFNTQLRILTSQGLLRRVARTLQLPEHPELLRDDERTGSTFDGVRRMFRLADAERSVADGAGELVLSRRAIAPAIEQDNAAETMRLTPAVEFLRERLDVMPVREGRSVNKETRLIDIAFRHTDPRFAARVVNTVADVFAISNIERKSAVNNSAASYLQQRIGELRSNIRAGEERLLAYGRANEILSLDGTQNTVVERLAGLNRELLAAQNDVTAARTAYNAAREPGVAGALAEDAVKQIEELESRLGALRQQRAQLLVEFTDEGIPVREVNEQIAAVEKQIAGVRNRATGNVLAKLESNYKRAVERERAVRADFDQQRDNTLTQNSAAVNYRIIQQEIDTNRKLLDDLMQNAKQNDIVLAGTPNNIDVLDHAEAPAYPVEPRRLRGVMLAFGLSLTFGVGLALFLEHLDDSVRTTGDVERRLRMPVLAAIPEAKNFVMRLLPGMNSNNEGGTEMLSNAASRPALGEAYRHLRTSVLLASPEGAPRTLVVTSSLPSEGKTTTAVNFALVLAQSGARVLLVDADLRRPRLHQLFGIENEEGLSTILAENFDPAESLDLIHKLEEGEPHVLTSGPVPVYPADLLGSGQMQRLLRYLSEHYTHIIIDSPPIASFTDGVLLSSMTDGVLLVVHSGRSSREVVQRSRRLLHDVGARVLGVVLNSVKPESNTGYRYYRYTDERY